MTRIDYYRAPAAHHATADQAGLESMGRTAWLIAGVTREALQGITVDAPDTLEATIERMALDHATELYAIWRAAVSDAEHVYVDRSWYRKHLAHDVRVAYAAACKRVEALP